jgi:hypothetical protein
MAMLPVSNVLTCSYAEEWAVMSPAVSRNIDLLESLYMALG